MTNLEVEYEFHPVGQGLFASGDFKINKRSGQKFVWVYDCGTSSKNNKTTVKASIEDAVDNYQSKFSVKPGDKPTIDLVTISHFDEDHINGIAALLSKFHVNRLLLPYLQLWQRLILAFAEGVDTQQSFMQFFVNPVEYLVGIEGSEIDEIVFVPPSEDEGPPFLDVETLPLTEDDESWHVEVDEREPVGKGEINDFETYLVVASGAKTSLKMMRAGGRIQVSKVWEFVPYNDASLAFKSIPRFILSVSKAREKLLNASTNKDRLNALKNIKNQYDKTFGKRQKNRNEISLFLYGGPLKAKFLNARIFVLRWLRRLRWQSFSPFKNTEKFAILYTGDGYLNTNAKLLQLRKYLGLNTRAKRLLVLQVMHHGSRYSWREGVAKKLNPLISVFCSNPNGDYFHPHAEVLRDFWLHSPVQVDKDNKFKVKVEFK